MHQVASKYSSTGRIACQAVFLLGIVYAVTTVLGFVSLKSPNEPIGDPFFTMMELLILLMVPFMVVSMIAVHYHAAIEDKIYSLAALLFMIVMAGISSCVHFLILTVSHQLDAVQSAEQSWFFSFKWPSVLYSLDILAWDWFFALSMFFAARVFKRNRLEKTIRVLMIICGLLSLAGLIGVPLKNMQVRNIGIIGYGVIGPFVFLLVGKVLRQTGQTTSSVNKNRNI